LAQDQQVLLVQSLDGSFTRRLGRGSNPSWSPDGRALLFIRDGQLWAADVETGEEAPLVRPQVPKIAETSWSPDGAHVAFRVSGSNSGIYAIDTRSGAERYLVPGSAAKVSPDGRRIGFILGEGALGFGGSIFTMSLEGTQIRRLGDVFYSDAISPCTSGPNFDWSPDSTRIAFWRYRSNNSPDSMFVVEDRDGAVPVGIGQGFGPTWSPDGDIAYTAQNPTRGGCDVWVREPDGSTRVFASGLLGSPWSPDGRRLAVRTVGPLYLGFQPVLVTLDTETGARLAAIEGAIDLGWSPEGDTISYRRHQGLQPGQVVAPPGNLTQLLLAKPDGSSERMLVEMPNLFDYAWSPDGRSIAYTAYDERFENASVYIIAADGQSPPRRIAAGRSPSWLPDGVHLLFTR
jgi:Tol biopolymer transport system component